MKIQYTTQEGGVWIDLEVTAEQERRISHFVRTLPTPLPTKCTTLTDTIYGGDTYLTVFAIRFSNDSIWDAVLGSRKEILGLSHVYETTDKDHEGEEHY